MSTVRETASLTRAVLNLIRVAEDEEETGTDKDHLLQALNSYLSLSGVCAILDMVAISEATVHNITRESYY